MMNVKSERDFLLAELTRHGRDAGSFNIAKYLGTSHAVLNVPVPKLRKIAASWTKNHKDISFKEYGEILGQLYKGPSREEKVLASMILGRFPKYLTLLDGKYLDIWLGLLEGWEEVDSMCDEIDLWFRADQKKRERILRKWNRDSQVEKRRASLVVLCSSVSKDSSVYLADLSFECIDPLRGEANVMITKAISWLLRSLIKYHKNDVAAYLKQNTATLPKIAVREVTRKLETGKK